MLIGTIPAYYFLCTRVSTPFVLVLFFEGTVLKPCPL